jgi:hypothetical protein
MKPVGRARIAVATSRPSGPGWRDVAGDGGRWGSSCNRRNTSQQLTASPSDPGAAGSPRFSLYYKPARSCSSGKILGESSDLDSRPSRAPGASRGAGPCGGGGSGPEAPLQRGRPGASRPIPGPPRGWGTLPTGPSNRPCGLGPRRGQASRGVVRGRRHVGTRIIPVSLVAAGRPRCHFLLPYSVRSPAGGSPCACLGRRLST